MSASPIEEKKITPEAVAAEMGLGSLTHGVQAPAAKESPAKKKGSPAKKKGPTDMDFDKPYGMVHGGQGIHYGQNDKFYDQYGKLVKV